MDHKPNISHDKLLITFLPGWHDAVGTRRQPDVWQYQHDQYVWSPHGDQSWWWHSRQLGLGSTKIKKRIRPIHIWQLLGFSSFFFPLDIAYFTNEEPDSNLLKTNIESVAFHRCKTCSEGTTNLSSEEVDDLERVLDNTDSHELLAVVATVHHEGVGQALHNGALGLAETLGSIASSWVGEVLGIVLLHSNIIL